MSVIGKIALQDIKLSLSLDQIALGELVLIGGDAQVVGVRCAYVPSFGPSKPGFLPLEGPNRYVFLEVPAGKRLPAIRVSKLAEMGLQSIAIDDTKRNLSLGDLCVLEEDESSALAVAIAFSADSGHLAGYFDTSRVKDRKRDRHL